ncbi:hypothetical protein CU633_12880 [Bacillus sp. V3-13]|uniref:hypothetical protein n=1 Tax=Bacillus sp. V3-13 TaxID=2053728 RepID=UPI000C78B9E6|nr:hypothetical protein [Bacillus sp. V3-13]PLR76960.1 hypothetical protein CU633_12880 [Bacillus sp. V3-13]
MEYLMLGMLALSILLIIVSMFLKDPHKEVRDDLDEFSLQQMQEIYQIKKKLAVLEEELLVYEDLQPSFVPKKKQIHAILKNQVISLAQQGLTTEQIARQSSLSTSEVNSILQELG